MPIVALLSLFTVKSYVASKSNPVGNAKEELLLLLIVIVLALLELPPASVFALSCYTPPLNVIL